MGGVADFLDWFNWVDRIDGLVCSLSSGGEGRWTFEIPRDHGWTGGQIERFLTHYGVSVWGRRVRSDSLCFSVKRRQANWAEYLLRRRGIPILNRSLNPLNEAYGEWYAPGSEPGDGSPRFGTGRSWRERFLSWLD